MRPDCFSNRHRIKKESDGIFPNLMTINGQPLTGSVGFNQQTNENGDATFVQTTTGFLRKYNLLYTVGGSTFPPTVFVIDSSSYVQNGVEVFVISNAQLVDS
jgi:hypothetical protein